MISIILPTYNEKEIIVPLIEAIAEVFSQMKKQLFEIIVVDDNSPDCTSEAVNKYLIKNSLFERSKRNNLFKYELATILLWCKVKNYN